MTVGYIEGVHAQKGRPDSFLYIQFAHDPQCVLDAVRGGEVDIGRVDRDGCDGTGKVRVALVKQEDWLVVRV